MDVTSTLSDSAVCDVFMEALYMLDDFNATCTAVVSGDKYTFTLKYPLEPAESVATKTADAKTLIVTSDFPGTMAAAAANQERRRLAALSVDSVAAWSKVQSAKCPVRSCASSGHAWRLWAARYSQEEASPLGAPPPRRVLEVSRFQSRRVPRLRPSRWRAAYGSWVASRWACGSCPSTAALSQARSTPTLSPYTPAPTLTPNPSPNPNPNQLQS